MCTSIYIARQLVLLLCHFALCSGHLIDPWSFRALICDTKFWHRLICSMSLFVAVSAVRSYCDRILKSVSASFLTSASMDQRQVSICTSVPIFRSVWMLVLFQCTQFALVVVVSSNMRCFLWKLFLNLSNTSIALTIFYLSRVLMQELMVFVICCGWGNVTLFLWSSPGTHFSL